MLDRLGCDKHWEDFPGCLLRLVGAKRTLHGGEELLVRASLIYEVHALIPCLWRAAAQHGRKPSQNLIRLMSPLRQEYPGMT